MAHKHILDHIEQEAKKGATRHDTRETLIARGWGAKELDAGFELLYPTPKAPMVTQTSSQNGVFSWVFRLAIGATVGWAFYT
jgi:hypothetical protein